jgi:hypothetical protein
VIDEEARDRLSTSDPWSFVEHELSGGIKPINFVGCVMPYEQARTIIDGLERFYDAVSDDAIRTYNDKTLDDLYESSYHDQHYRAVSKEEDGATRRREPMPGFVYILGAGDYYKIGKAKVVTDRIKQIIPKLPFEVEIVYTIKSDDPYELEKFLHEQFADKRANGEWFKLCREDIEYIKSLPER